MPRKNHNKPVPTATIRLPHKLDLALVANALTPGLKYEVALHLISLIVSNSRKWNSQAYGNAKSMSNFEKAGYSSISAETMKKKVHTDYSLYLKALVDADIVQVFKFGETEQGKEALIAAATNREKDREYAAHYDSLSDADKACLPAPRKYKFDNGAERSNVRGVVNTGSYMPGEFTKAYRINPIYMPKQNEYEVYTDISISDAKTISKLQRITTAADSKVAIATRRELVAMAKRIVEGIDVKHTDATVKSWFNTHLERMKTNTRLKYFTLQGMRPKEAVVWLEDIQKEFWFLDYEEHGGRIITPISATDRMLRPFHTIDGELAWGVDIKNSQFFMLSQVMIHPEATKRLFGEKLTEEITNAVDELAALYNSCADTKAFADAAAEGQLYEYVATTLHITRNEAKSLVLSITFAGQLEYHEKKRQLRPIINNLLDTIGRLNDPLNVMSGMYNKDTDTMFYNKKKAKSLKAGKTNTVSKLLQQFESMMFIDRASVGAVVEKMHQHDFESVHDSFHCHGDDVAALSRVLVLSFLSAGFDVPKVDTKQLTFDYPQSQIDAKFTKKTKTNK